MTGRITRRRTIKSCKYCYDHKLKCDKARPCSTCSGLNTTDQCIYGFAKQHSPVDSTKDLAAVKKPHLTRAHNIKKIGKDSVVYKSKYSYPFFTSSINDKILSAGRYDKVALSSVFIRNEVHKFDRSASPARNFDEVLSLLPSLKESALSHVDTYFERIHPMLPVFSQEKVLSAFTDVYHSLEAQRAVNAPSILVVMAIFFCSSYAAVASGIIPDLLLCNNYYRAFRFLLDIVEFPFKPLLESLQAFAVVNFVIDPNMVDATAYSAMLVRMGQELGLHKGPITNTVECKLLWNLLLYIEGSSSVVRGFSFLAPSSLINAVSLPDLITDVNCHFPVSYTIGRCKINIVFREVMELTSREIISRSDVYSVESHIEKLYREVCSINASLRRNHPTYCAYFASTLNVFLYRLHLRYFALSCLQTEEDKVLHRTSNEISSVGPMDITGILEVKQNFKEEVVQLSLLLLFHTFKRLVQKNIDKFVWYTRGSTVMQYLFVIIKDLFQNAQQAHKSDDFSKLFRQTIDEDMEEIIDTSPTFYKYVLVDGVLALMELKLAALWNNEDLYKFLMVKAVKEKVWQANGGLLKLNDKSITSLKKCALFAVGLEQLQNAKSINFEECLKSWESDEFSANMDRILTNWLGDFHDL